MLECEAAVDTRVLQEVWSELTGVKSESDRFECIEHPLISLVKTREKKPMK